MEALYHLVTTSVEAYLGGDYTLSFNKIVYRIRSKVHFLFLGMGSVASTAAIGNVVTVEPLDINPQKTVVLPLKSSFKFWQAQPQRCKNAQA